MKNIALSLALFCVFFNIALSAPEIEYESKNDSNSVLNFKWTYPVISGLEEKSAQKLINGFYLDELENSFEELKKMSLEDAQIRKDSNLGEPVMFESINKCEAKIIFDNYLSVRSELYEFVGGANGNTKIIYDLFDLRTGELIPRENFFLPDSDYVSIIAPYCIEELKAKLALDSCEFFEEGAASDYANYKILGVTDKGLAVVFPEYQVTIGACGYKEVIVPFDRIKSMMNSNILDFIRK